MAHIKAAGKVKRIINGYGFVLEEITTGKDGEARSSYFTVWDRDYQANNIIEGADVVVSGALGVKLEEFTGRDGEQRKTAAAHINNPTVQLDNPF